MRACKTGQKKQILEIIFQYIRKESCAIFLFGSFAKDKIYPSSDIDIGIICRGPLKNSLLVRVKEKLREKVKTLRDIDVVDFSGVHDRDFLKIALKETKIWHQTPKSGVYFDNLRKRIKD